LAAASTSVTANPARLIRLGNGTRLLPLGNEAGEQSNEAQDAAPPYDGALPDREGALRMSKALMGHVGQPPAYMILRELGALKARVAELERALAVAEREIALRSEENLTTTEKEPALA
jgi:hypothetical protein